MAFGGHAKDAGYRGKPGMTVLPNRHSGRTFVIRAPTTVIPAPTIVIPAKAGTQWLSVVMGKMVGWPSFTVFQPLAHERGIA